jgi:type VI secretion system protein
VGAFLSRIERAADPTSAERSTARDTDVERAVLAHLGELLNTRQGSALTVPDYGLVEVSEVLYDFPDAIGIMQRALKNTIQTYEPRLKNVQVRHLKDEVANHMILQFEITGQLHLPDGRRTSLRVATQVDGSGNVKVD